MAPFLQTWAAGKPVLRVFQTAMVRPLARWTTVGRDSSSRPEKRQLIEAIQQLNPSATSKFLNRFDLPALQRYLEHLQAPRGGCEQVARSRRPIPVP